ncbi:TetR/AcrR family transcriptional regulator [Paenibacillus peoriae]|uniref:TetR/AcrR family transcriptional regulator n=1 Tax=Paenibacillus peoriae TaxID=59893 RepID=UPI00026C66DF|nr:TetR/AcrR family transcriptional regulator [Paenibacillus peoriae]MEC0182436.1 TetR/AcrR family transcriptional regulator [Paenibacillus peoriae]
MDLKDKIVEATERVLLMNGLAKTTTKEIARAAGCSEGSLYNHFRNKEDIFLHVLQGKLKNLMNALTLLQSLAGKETVRRNLEQVALAALEDYHTSMPIICSIFSEPSILLRHRESFTLRNESPYMANEVVEAYLLKEREMGRISEKLHPRTVADLLLGGCFQRSFQLNFLGEEESQEKRVEFVNLILDTFFVR